ncbi:hypothetical protein Hanom_Chr09g00830821 [Helianthus anomalus]
MWVKAGTAEEAKKKAEEARDISTSALNVAQKNYVEAQSIVDTLVSESEWMRNRGVVAMPHAHVEEVFGRQFDTHNFSVTDQADSILSRAEEVYDHLSLPVMELVTEALKHDDWCARLRSIIDPPETVELSDEEEATDGDGDGDGDDDGDGYE